MRSLFSRKRLVPVYAARYSQEELDSIVAFYKTLPGRRWRKKPRRSSRKTATVGREWIQEVAGKVQADLQTVQAKAGPPAGTASATKTTFDKKPFKTSGKVVKTASGLQYDDMTVGKAKPPSREDCGSALHGGRSMDGTSSTRRVTGAIPFDFVLGARECD
jgi:FKBP-type peptidyl-prolyl cis-trans isomerase